MKTLHIRLIALAILFIGIFIGTFALTQYAGGAKFPFHYGLDLSGGTHLVYEAKTQDLAPADVAESMSALRDTIERRVNLFGVSEPLVQTEKASSLSSGGSERLIIELPGVTDTQKAIDMIGATPVLEFKLLQEDFDTTATGTEPFIATELTGRYLKRANLEFGTAGGTLSNEPVVVLNFNSEGSDLFAQITKDNVGRVLGIFLDGQPISTPVINQEIVGGTATISGGFAPEEARELVRNLNFGALPVGVELLSVQTVGASLGKDVLDKGVYAGIVGLLLVALFLLLWYRLPGFIAIMSLSLYIVLMLAIFKLLPVTLTAAGIAGFILSIGLAVDANVLIFERMKEELKEGKSTHTSITDGFARAWTSIRDGNLTSIITAVILFWFGTSMVEGFALVFGIGVLVSMLTAITVSRTLLYALGDFESKGIAGFLFSSGISK